MIGNTDDLHVLNRLVSSQVLLDFFWVDVLAASDDHLFDSADDLEVAAFIELPEITRFQPFIGSYRIECRFLVIPVLLHDSESTETYLSLLADRHGVPSCVDEFGLRMREDRTNRGTFIFD